MNTRFAAASLRIKYIPVEGTMMIDPDTARNLELVANMTHKKSTHSLFGLVVFLDRQCRLLMIILLFLDRVLNHTYTPMASRLLRANILSPITGEFPSLSLLIIFLSHKSCLVHNSVDARLDVVEGKKKVY